MKFTKTDIVGCFIIEPEPFTDERGVFRRHFDSEEFKTHGLSPVVKQCNVSENKYRYTLRGFHYQKAPYEEDKTLSCFRGAVHDIVVDLRPSSKTYLKWQGFDLSDKNRLSLHIPAGCAHAYLTLEPDSVVYYYVSQRYHPKAEKGIRFNDPFFKFEWPHEPKHISQKDSSYPDFSLK